MSDSKNPEQTSERSRLAEQVSALASSETVQTMFDVGQQVQAEANDVVRSTLAVEHGLCTALVGSIAWFADALYLNRSEQRFFPPDWLDPTCSANPDFAMACVLCQLANYGHSVIELVSKGLDTPSRALLRATSDLSYMVVALSVDRETFRSFFLDDISSPKEHWYKLFSNKKLAQRVARSDQSFGLPQEWTQYMQEFRDATGEFFSEAVHHSRDSILIGSQPTVPGTDRVAFALLGGPPSGSKHTLTHLATVLNYGLTTFIASSSRRPEYFPRFAHQEYWDAGLAIHKEIQPLFLQMLAQQEN
ncbi:hypothetical protein [Trinickia fusca]|uniref:hypothetical protein n=1 Tax=Trinickia fusca TaxID=2419777 RepID=UPI0011C45B9A|nr:hypothetical protein [Trinickia fusca]